MKLSVILAAVSGTVFASAAVVTTGACAPDPANPFPSCADSCMADAIKAVGCTGITDYACQCKNFETLHTSAAPCIDKACGAQASQVASAAQALCSACN
ncbi:Extracellular membrane protein, CFEM domain protein [Niveomyces insectorum RCEF 264]|uniref:Extracellular membrane protein, CFEM domain protein n=1 Tax=Niveomyces insectorum RCEF 264 TaxID=1081102 RepID=A0A167XSR7_9HYPO|nr:Extracellular membrane protein, CFEM domain protein [Niveomyces insectorum RCEF 264]